MRWAMTASARKRHCQDLINIAIHIRFSKGYMEIMDSLYRKMGRSIKNQRDPSILGMSPGQWLEMPRAEQGRRSAMDQGGRSRAANHHFVLDEVLYTFLPSLIVLSLCVFLL